MRDTKSIVPAKTVVAAALMKLAAASGLPEAFERRFLFVEGDGFAEGAREKRIRISDQMALKTANTVHIGLRDS